MSYQKRLIFGCVARHSLLNVSTSWLENFSGSNFRQEVETVQERVASHAPKTVSYETLIVRMD